MALKRKWKFLGMLIGAFAVVFGVSTVMSKTKAGQSVASKLKGSAATGTQAVNKLDGVDAVNVCVVTWGGYAGGEYFNNGFKATKESRYWSEYKLPVNFVLIEEAAPALDAWKSDQCNLLWTTADAFPTQAGSLAEYKPQIVFQSDWSRGGDVIVATAAVKSVKDLAGKKVALLRGSPSHTLFLKSLEAAGMTERDVQVVSTKSAPDAAKVFKNGEADAAVVWSPDDKDLVNPSSGVAGAHVLASSKQAANIIADVFFAKQAYIESHGPQLKALVEGWLKGAAEINSSPDARARAVQILTNGLNQPQDFIDNAINNVRLTTYGDNVAFFNLQGSSSGTTGQYLYEDMGRKYRMVGLVDGNVPSWRDVTNMTALRSITLAGPENAPEGTIRFAKATADVVTSAPAFADKPVSIEFPTNSSELTEDARIKIDSEVGAVVKGFTGARIRIIGNTDSRGNETANEALSRRRAEAVAQYLIQKFNFDPNRFVVRGDGSQNPVADNATDAGRAKNRRTDVQVVAAP
jgi:NitT/TauT family transport system substrate-binding protein